MLAGLVDGARHLKHRRSAGAALSGVATHRLMFGISTAAVVMLYRYHFTTDADDALKGIALVLGAVGAGSFAAVVVTPWATERIRIEIWVPIMLVTCGVLEFALCATFREGRSSSPGW
ncbi:hypothetical protein GCM10027612_06970 [Microbispora bryophytorum subsp. camponoti]